jgi:hypothetical protein
MGLVERPAHDGQWSAARSLALARGKCSNCCRPVLAKCYTCAVEYLKMPASKRSCKRALLQMKDTLGLGWPASNSGLKTPLWNVVIGAPRAILYMINVGLTA